MRLILVCFSLICFLCFSCNRDPKPQYRLSDEELVNLMFDVHLAEVIIPSTLASQQDSIRNIYWKKLTEIYQLTDEEIKEEIDKLESDPQKLKKIIDAVRMKADSLKVG